MWSPTIFNSVGYAESLGFFVLRVEWQKGNASLPVHEVTNNQTIEANHIYVIPPDTGLTIVEGVLKLVPRPKVRTPHRPIDSFFESLAQD